MPVADADTLHALDRAALPLRAQTVPDVVDAERQVALARDLAHDAEAAVVLADGQHVDLAQHPVREGPLPLAAAAPALDGFVVLAGRLAVARGAALEQRARMVQAQLQRLEQHGALPLLKGRVELAAFVVALAQHWVYFGFRGDRAHYADVLDACGNYFERHFYC